jgi:hypothetical protein
MTERQADQMVAEALPKGSTRKQVEMWLDSQQIQHGNMTDGNGNFAGISGSFPDPMLSLFFNGQIRLEFYFDEEGRLVGRLVRAEVIGF